MQLSTFGNKFTSHSGILQLMDDLGNALANGGENTIMMGGGNPAQIASVEEVFRKRLQKIIDTPAKFQRLIGIYAPPQGEKTFIRELVRFLNRRFGWSLTQENITTTHGSQSAFFTLFNMFAGQYSDGSFKHIQLPLAPEYIGYSDAGLTPDFFVANRPEIEHLSERTFKYHINFERLKLSSKTGAMCISRPTNPTGNVLTNEEMSHLNQLAQKHDIPLIVDGAYGTPFPNLIYTEATPEWNDNTILTLSLSKLGLPAARTGIVIANPMITKALSSINTIMSLAPNSIGSLLALEMVRDGSISTLSETVIRPFYEEKAQFAIRCLEKSMQETPWKIHKPEGAMFLWLWLPDLPISSQTLYERLKARGVLIVSGHHFFTGIKEDWPHRHECLRITYSQDNASVARGIDIISEEVKSAYLSS